LQAKRIPEISLNLFISSIVTISSNLFC
jgi:hypothetical protein